MLIWIVKRRSWLAVRGFPMFRGCREELKILQEVSIRHRKEKSVIWNFSHFDLLFSSCIFFPSISQLPIPSPSSCGVT